MAPPLIRELPGPAPVLRRRLLLGCMCAWLRPAHGGLAQRYVVVVHPTVALPSPQLIANLYLGGSAGWTPLDLALPPDERREVYLALTGYGMEHVQTQWARLVFTGRGQPPRMMKRPEDLRLAVAQNPRLLGYLPRSDVDGSVKIALQLE